MMATRSFESDTRPAFLSRKPVLGWSPDQQGDRSMAETILYNLEG